MKFLPAYNGISILNKKCIEYSHTLHIDASLTGLGGVWAYKVYSTPTYNIPKFTMKIVHWEMFNILLALRVWGHNWRNSIVEIHCDNLAVVQVVTTSKTKDPFLAACIRNIWLLTATQDIDLRISHIKGVVNTIADLLSRLHSGKGVNGDILRDLQRNYQWFKIPISFFNYYLYQFNNIISGSTDTTLPLLHSAWQKIQRAILPRLLQLIGLISDLT